MASNEVCVGGADVLSEHPLQFKMMDMFDFDFFNFLCEKNDQYFVCEWDRPKELLKIKVDTKEEKEIAIRLINTVRNSFKKMYELSAEKMKIGMEFLHDSVTIDTFSDIFIDATTNSTAGRFVIMASNDHDEMYRKCKHKFEVKIDRKRIRSTRMSRRRKSSQRPVLKRQTSVLRSSEKKHIFITFEKIYVKIITDNLENLDGHVDGIVNPINDKLETKGQVSKFLTDRGGDKYVEERDRIYSEKSKSIRPGSVKCFTTGAGDLKAKGVLHVVCPKLQSDKDANVENIVFKTVYECLKRAESKRLESVAIPFLYTGNGNVPVERCAVPYALAVLEFSRQRVDTYVVDTIYFIDLDENKTLALAKYFDELLPKTFNQILELPVMHNDIASSDRLKADTNICPPRESEIQVMPSEKETSSAAVDTQNAVKEPAFNGDSYANDDGYERICTNHDERQSEMAFSNSPQSECQNSDHSKYSEDKETVDTYDTIKFADDDSVSNEQKETAKDETVESDKLTKPTLSDDGYDTIQDITDSRNTDKDVLKTGKQNTVENLGHRLHIIDETDMDTAVNAEKELDKNKAVVGYCETEHGQDRNQSDIMDKPSSLVNRDIDQASLDTWTNIDGGDIIEDTGTNIDGEDIIEDTGTNIDGGDIIEVTRTNIDGGEDIENTGTNTDGGDSNEDTGTNIDGGDDFENKLSEQSEKNCSHDASLGKMENIAGITKAKIKPVNKGTNEKPYCYIQAEENVDNVSSEQEKHIIPTHDYYNLGDESLKHKEMIGERSEVINRSNNSEVVHQRSKHFHHILTTNKLSVEILKGDIREAQADVIVCPEIKDTKYGGLLTVAIKSAYRNKTGIETPKKVKTSKGKRIATTNCHLATTGASKPNVENVKFLYHVQTLVYKTPGDETKLARCIDLVIRKLKNHRDRHVESIAFPLLGIEDVSEKECVQKCCEILAKEVYKSCRKYEADIVPLKVMLINRCGQITEMLNKEMNLQVGAPAGSN
ncbi:uncharacterized protein LOC123546413 [Mercenaria mercenaria]|uniref:uncharacterized protein LOC123546413 n=1 Tax=Mercenaria mercenaria TaxID=6596 RepID=UPI00234EC839|nr:uncharacterized protein LOC123546413 [Mercenaria mercenaria]XP_045188598.2 uncharacterized protein LOC123546413 [Mercenaria mercenaria]